MDKAFKQSDCHLSNSTLSFGLVAKQVINATYTIIYCCENLRFINTIIRRARGMSSETYESKTHLHAASGEDSIYS